jgi:hypothetical protein
MGKQPKIPDPGKAAVAGIQADTELAPFQYLINAASTLGVPITIDGHTYDFSGLGQADTARAVSDKMAQTLLDLQKQKSPEIIQQRLNELKAADPEGYAAKQQLFDKIMADAKANPDRPVATELQKSLQDELAKGVGFDDARQEQQVREGVRGDQAARGITLGNAPSSQEAKTVLGAGENLRNQREQNALNLLESGASPEDVAYRRFQQSVSNLGAFASGETPEAQFGQVSAAGSGPVSLTGGAPNTNTFNPGAAGQGVNNALGIYGAQSGYNATQANPWLAGLSIGGQTLGTLQKTNPSWFQNPGSYPGVDAGGNPVSVQPGY